MKKILAFILVALVAFSAAGCQAAPAQAPEAEEVVDAAPVFESEEEKLLAAPEDAIIPLVPAELITKYGFAYNNLTVEKTLGDEVNTLAVITQSEAEGNVEDVTAELLTRFEKESSETPTWNMNAELILLDDGYAEISKGDVKSVVRMKLDIAPEEEAVEGEEVADETTEEKFDKLFASFTAPTLELESENFSYNSQRIRFEGGANFFVVANTYLLPIEEIANLKCSADITIPTEDAGYVSLATEDGLVTATTHFVSDENALVEVALKKYCLAMIKETKDSQLALDFYADPYSTFASSMNKNIATLITDEAETFSAEYALLEDGSWVYSNVIGYEGELEMDAFAETLKKEKKITITEGEEGIYSAPTVNGWMYVVPMKKHTDVGFNRPMLEDEEPSEIFAKMPAASFTNVSNELSKLKTSYSANYNAETDMLFWETNYENLPAESYQNVVTKLVTNLANEFSNITLTELVEAEQEDSEEETEAETDTEETSEGTTEAYLYSEKGLNITATNGGVMLTLSIIPNDDGGYYVSVINALN